MSSTKKSTKTIIRKILIAIVVFAIAWYFGGKPMPQMEDGSLKFVLTEYPISKTIQETVREKTNISQAVRTESTSAQDEKETSVEPVENIAVSTKKSAQVKTSDGNGTSGSNPDVDQGHAENNPLFFGNSSDALNKTSSDKNYLMEKKQFTISYNRETLCPNWVAWHLDSKDIGDAERSDDFRADKDLPADWYGITKTDYQYNAYGFDRGHVCPSADRTATKEDNSMTFLMTNMVPQSPDNNRVIWMHFENYERKLVSQGNEVYIIAGPYGTGGTSSKGTFDSIPVKLKSGETLNMNVPAYTWKVCLVIPEGEDDISRITKDTTVIAINVPNEMGMGKTGDWEQFLTTVDEIESLTGYDFFELLPDEIEDALESKVYEY